MVQLGYVGSIPLLCQQIQVCTALDVCPQQARLRKVAFVQQRAYPFGSGLQVGGKPHIGVVLHLIACFIFLDAVLTAEQLVFIAKVVSPLSQFIIESFYLAPVLSPEGIAPGYAAGIEHQIAFQHHGCGKCSIPLFGGNAHFGGIKLQLTVFVGYLHIEREKVHQKHISAV